MPITRNTPKSVDASKTNEEDYAHLVPLPPDKGYGWIIIAICCFGNFCIDSVPIAFGVLQPNIVTEFKYSSGQVAWMISIFLACLYFMGPIAGGLVNRYGFRLMMCFGALMGSGAFFSCYFIKNILLMYCIYSVTAGIGVSLVYMTTMTCPGFWFEKKRTLAMGLASCSTGLSCTIVPVLSDHIKNDYHWNYIFFMEGALFLIAMILSLFLRKPPMALVELTERKTTTGLDLTSRVSIKSVTPYTRTERSRVGDRQPSMSVFSIRQQKVLSNTSVQPMEPIEKKKTKCKRWIFNIFCCKSPNKLVTRPLYKEDIFYQSEVSRLIVAKNVTAEEYRMSVVRLPSRKDVLQEQEYKCVCCPEAITNPLKEMLAFSLLKNEVYIFLLCASFFYYFGIMIPFIYLNRTYISKGVDKKLGLYFIPVLGIGVTTSRLLIGFFILLFKNLQPVYVIIVGMPMAAIVYLLMMVYIQAYYLYIMSFFLGLFAGVFIPLRSMLYVEYLGLENLTKAMGLTFTIQACGSFLGVPFAELMQTIFNDIHAMNLVCAMSLFLASFFFILVDMASKRQKKNSNPKLKQMPLKKDTSKEKRLDETLHKVILEKMKK